MIQNRNLTEAQNLTLFHLAGVFFHEKADEISIFANIQKNFVEVTLSQETREHTERIYYGKEVSPWGERNLNTALGMAFALCAKVFTSYHPPYGTLIGVRPVKVALNYLKKNFSEQEILSVLEQEYFVLPKKAVLLLDLAKKELGLEQSLEKDAGMLYLSIPFCPSRCSYCSFISSSSPKHLALIPSYLDLFMEEIKETAILMEECGKKLSAVYMGGGTPGILTAKQMHSVLQQTLTCFPQASSIEFCVEMGRPDTITQEKLLVLKENGVNRISINPQTTSDITLSRIGRKHTTADFLSAMEMAKAMDFYAINCDLIAGLPGETPEIFLKSVSQVLSCQPENLTIHALCKKKSASEQVLPQNEINFLEAMEEAHKLCIKNLLSPYYLYRQKMAMLDLENLGFAKDNKICLYNLAMMEDMTDIFSCGAGAISKVLPGKSGKILRFAGYKYPYEYLANPEKIKTRIQDMKKAIIAR